VNKRYNWENILCNIRISSITTMAHPIVDDHELSASPIFCVVCTWQ